MSETRGEVPAASLSSTCRPVAATLTSTRPRDLRPVLVVLDVDGVTSPVHGATAWTDDVETGDVFGPVVVSPSLVRHLDGLGEVPGVTCLWMTDWTPEMRQRMRTFPGRDWPHLERSDSPTASQSWWKFAALHRWLTETTSSTPQDERFGSLAWLDDDLSPGTFRAACKRLLQPLIPDILLVPPSSATGLTPSEMVEVGEWIKARIEVKERHRLDQPWRRSPVGPCGCSWVGWHCPHCGLVTDTGGDAWHPFHTIRCHRRWVGRGLP
ncbi:MAG: hypothetical protein WA966_11075 [Ornithinimicrobium sp.]